MGDAYTTIGSVLVAVVISGEPNKRTLASWWIGVALIIVGHALNVVMG